MVSGVVGDIERSPFSDYGVAAEGESLVRELVALGIDDLAKFQIIRLLHRSPNIAGGADFYAMNLGLHSVEATAALLEELAKSGVLAKEWPAGSAQPRFRWADDWGMRRHVMKLYNLAQLPANGVRVLRMLAARSLGKAQKRRRAMALAPADTSGSLLATAGAV